MNSNVDVIKELAVKNKEIYFNKLNIDLDNSEENLLITIDNIISLFTKEVTDKVLDIECTTLFSQQALQEVLAFHKIIHEELRKLVNERFNELREKVKKIENIVYKDELNKGTDNLINKLQKCYMDNIDKLIGNLTKKSNAFTKERVEDYLKNSYYEKFINKVKDAINNIDIILYNNYQEAEKKYNELNKKVIN